MFQRKARRRSVILDMHGRIESLVDFSQNVLVDSINIQSYIDKQTLIDYLNLTKIIISKLSKADLCRLEFDKISYDHIKSHSVYFDANEFYESDRNVWSRSDSYIRAVGNFSNYMSAEELTGRIKSLSPQILKATEQLILCIHSYAITFYDSSNNDHDASHQNPYIDALTDFNPNICLLTFLDTDKIVRSLSEIGGTEISRMNGILTTFLPKVSVDQSSNSVTFFQKLSNKFSKKDRSNAQSLIGIIEKYWLICQELHVDKHLRYVQSNLPPKTPILPLLQKRIIEKFPDLKIYVNDHDAEDNHIREIYDSFVTLTLSIIDGVAILAAFRTMLLSKELEVVKNDAINSLLDVPDKADLEAFLNQIQPNNL